MSESALEKKRRLAREWYQRNKAKVRKQRATKGKAVVERVSDVKSALVYTAKIKACAARRDLEGVEAFATLVKRALLGVD